jgi:hypothetical protein
LGKRLETPAATRRPDRDEEEDTMIRISLLAALMLAVTALPSYAEGPVKSTAQGVAKGTKEIGQGVGAAGKGVAKGTVAVAKGTGTAVKKTGKGVWCIVTLGYGC